ncbi:MAG: bifunctional tetrahydrofolate synthase/dihydrofolate synthase [Gammaproteobacteria bacterium]|nr:bifunctional tetrahydrofolate synthase/dihydrofolate synthase [Gammaproteobacteria bacterium]
MNFSKCLDFLNKLHKLNHKSSLMRFKQKLHELNCYPRTPKIFTVAGTNGKGTCCVTLEAILLAAGYKTGCYLSPHLLGITERFRIEGQNISEAEFCVAFAQAQLTYQDEAVGWFEFISLIAILVFAAHTLDFLILEIGIGGKQDVINAIDADVAIITTIDLDHIEILGATRELIGAEKAGIFRSHKLAICADPNPPQTVIDYAHDISANLILVGHDYADPKTAAIAALRHFSPTSDISGEIMQEGISHVFLPARFQIIKQHPLVICDVAHNPHAARYLAQALAKQTCLGNTYAVVGMQVKKDIPNTLAPMLNVVDQWYISNLGDNLGEQDGSMASFVSIAQNFLQQADAQFTVVPSITAGLELALQMAQAEDRIIIFGSFLTIEEVLKAKCLLQ